MEISRAAIGIVAAAGLAVGAGGAYFLTRGPGTAAVPAEPATTVSLAPGPSVSPAEAALDGDRNVSPVTAPAVPDQPASADRRPAGPATRRESSQVRDVERIEAPPVPVVPAEPLPPDPVEQPPTIAAVEPSRPAEPIAPELIELVVPAESVIGLQLDSSLTSERSRVEDEVVAHVVRDVRVGDRVAIPARSKAYGEVTVAERGGRLKERGRLAVRFTSLVLPDGTRLAIQTEPIFREGDAQGAASSAKITGGAIGGAILGGIIGGAKGAAIGGSVGAGAGTAAVLAGERNQAQIPAGSPVTIRVEAPIVITVEN